MRLSTRPICATCHQPITGEVYTLGRHTYDAAHFQNLARENAAAARPLMIVVGAVVVFTALVVAVVQLTHPTLTGTPLLVAGLLLAVIPAAIWLLAFYQADALEPEPKQYVI